MSKKRELRAQLAALPMPLAQLGRRALNAQPGLERHNSAFYLGEASLKLAAAGRIGLYLDRAFDPDSRLVDALRALALPSLGHWFGFFRDVSDALSKAEATKGKPLAVASRKLGQSPAEAPWIAVPAFAKAAIVAGVVKEEIAKKATRGGALAFYEILVAYRNEVIGHGAQRTPAFYAEMGDALLEAVLEVLRLPDVFGGLHLVAARHELEGQKVKTTLKDLTGLAALPLDEPAHGATAGRLYFSGEALLVPLYPLVRFEDAAEERFSFLNKTAGGKKGEAADIKRAEYLDYLSGESHVDPDGATSLGELLAKLGPPKGTKEGAAEEPKKGTTEIEKNDEREDELEDEGSKRPKATADSKPVAPEAGRGKMIAGGAAVLATIGAVAIWQITSKPTAATSPSSSASTGRATTSAPASAPSAPSAVSSARSAPAAKAPPALKVAWARGYGTSAIESLKGIAAGRAGVYGAVDSLGSDGLRDGAVVALSPTGELQWEIAIENEADLDLRAIGVAGDRVVVAGFFEKEITCQEKKVSTPAKWGLFTAELAASTGKLQSLRAYGGKDLSLFAARLAIAVDDAGVVLGGAFGGKLDLGCGEKTAGGLLDGFVARLDTKGKCAFMRSLGDAGLQAVESVGVDVSGDIAIAGELSGNIEFGAAGAGGTDTLASEGGIDLFVAKLDPKGAHKWSHRFGSTSSLNAGARVAAHALGSVVLTGWFGGTIDFGAGPLTASGAHDLVVARFSPAGKLEFSRQIKTKSGKCDGECDPDWIGLATTDRGDALVALPFDGTIDLGDGASLTSAGSTDLALVDVDPKGVLVGAVRLGDAATQCPPFQCRLSVAAIGSTLYAGGLFLGRLDADLEAVAGDAFLLQLGE